MKVPSLRGLVEIDEPSFHELRNLINGEVTPSDYSSLVRVYMAGAKAMRDEIERGSGARLEAALMGVYKDK